MKALVQKGRISLFGLIFIFCRVELIFGRLTCFDMKSIIAYLFLLICALFSRNNVWKKPQFSKGIFWRSFVE